MPGMAAANAGLAPGMKVLGVNGRVYDKDRLRPAIAATAAGQPLELLVSSHEYLHTLRLAYDGGLRYPHLVRDESKPDLLAQVVAPRP